MRSLLFVPSAAVLALSLSVPASADESFASYGKVVAARDGAGNVTIAVTGSGEWHVNAEYGPRVAIGAEKLGKDDAKFDYENAEMRDKKKATKATFTAHDPAPDGTVKAVFCNASSCTSPLKSAFAVTKS